jgi:transcriptional regulator with XRE-family HTH domain
MHMLRPETPKKLSFGEALRSFRTDRGLSHHDVSLRAGARQEAVRQWEQDQLTPTSVQLKRLTATFPKLKHYSPTAAERPSLASVAPARCPEGLVSPPWG